MTTVQNQSTTTKTELPAADNKVILLSDVCEKHLIAGHRSDTFVKEFKDAIREGQFKAAVYKGKRFTLPKKFTRRHEEGTFTKDSRDYMIQNSEEFHEWFNEINSRLLVSREGGKIPLTAEAINAGLIDFDELADETRQKLKRSHEKGRNLGMMHSKKRNEAEEAEDTEEEIEEVTPVKKAPAKKAPSRAKKAPEPVIEEDEDEEDDDDDILDE